MVKDNEDKCFKVMILGKCFLRLVGMLVSIVKNVVSYKVKGLFKDE